MRSVAILLSNLRAEGGPALAADLCAEWIRNGIEPRVLLLNDSRMEMEPRFLEMGIEPEILGSSTISPGSYPRIFDGVNRVLRHWKPRGLLSIPSGVHGAIFAAAAWAGVRHRAVHLGTYPWHWQSGFWKYRLLMRAAASVTPDLICVTEHVRAGVAAHFGNVAARIHVIPNGIDLNRFAFRRRQGRNGAQEPVTILMVGRLDGEKDHRTLIEAAGNLQARGVRVRVKLAGDGPTLADLQRLVIARGLKENVEFLGARRDVPELLANADVFVFSVRAQEGLGIALVEAMASGVPIVATDVGACREVLSDGACGLLTRENDSAGIADAIVSCIHAPEPAEKRARAARARAESTYNRRQRAERYLEICGAA
jgi:glycosyltransferase involved in cell wall biosynthesis